jgi:hypothetical protein
LAAVNADLSVNFTAWHETEITREEIMSADVLDLGATMDHDQELDHTEVIDSESSLHSLI